MWYLKPVNPSNAMLIQVNTKHNQLEGGDWLYKAYTQVLFTFGLIITG